MLSPGTQLGKYRLERLLGTGGMGAVWEAHDVDLDRKVALKVLGEGLAGDATAQARLLREARAMARLRHANVVAVYDALTLDGHDVIVMELVDGTTLAQWLADAPRTPEDIMPVLLAAGRGLAAAHAAGMVHRDFKPHNVLVDREGRVLVTDFGLARSSELASLSDSPLPPALETTAAGGTVSLVRGDAATMAITPRERGALETPLTRTGALLGTPAYMAPEQLRGEPADARADQFAFCVTAWEALAGTRPYSGTTLGEIARSIERGDRAEAVRIPKPLRAPLERGLSAEPAARWPSMPPLLDALAPAPTRRSRAPLWIALGAAAVVAAGAGVYLASRDGHSTDELVRKCGDQTFRVSSGQHGTCRTTTVSPQLFELECSDGHGNSGKLECANGFSNCETSGTGLCSVESR
ncbi:MAG TPA: serine/threonine-protein kinase [Kofleriaceae bacterium]|nr:serine/threonine-protein kinase [Kofleriaceae bacterium]